MLLKWAIGGKCKSRLLESFRLQHNGHDSICTKPSTPQSLTVNCPESSEGVPAHASAASDMLSGMEAKSDGDAVGGRAIAPRDEKLLADGNAKLY